MISRGRVSYTTLSERRGRFREERRGRSQEVEVIALLLGARKISRGGRVNCSILRGRGDLKRW